MHLLGHSGLVLACYYEVAREILGCCCSGVVARVLIFSC